MSVNTTIRTASFTGDGVTRSFTIPFPVRNREDLKVYLVSGSTLTELKNEIGFTFVGNVKHDIEANFSITTTAAPGVGITLFVYRETPFILPLDLVNGDPFLTAILEGGYDRITMMFQEIAEELERVTLGSITDPELSGDGVTSKYKLTAMVRVVSHAGSGEYNATHVIPKNQATGWTANPVLPAGQFKVYELNGAEDIEPGSVYPARVIKDTAGKYFLAIDKRCECSFVPVYNVRLSHVNNLYPSFVVSRDTQIPYEYDILNTEGRADPEGNTTLGYALPYLASNAFLTDYDPDFTVNPQAVSLTDDFIYYWTGINPNSGGYSGNWLGTCWTWSLTTDPVSMPKGSGEEPFMFALVSTDYTNAGGGKTLFPLFHKGADCADSRVFSTAFIDYDFEVPSPEPTPIDCNDPANFDLCSEDDSNQPDPTDIWVQMRECGGALVDLWRPERLSGVFTNLNPTIDKVVEYGGTCYEPTNFKANVPGTVMDNAQITASKVDCSDCDAAPVSCNATQPTYLGITTDVPLAGNPGMGGVAALEVSDPLDANWAALDQAGDMVLTKNGSCDWVVEAALDGVASRTARMVYRYDGVAPNRGKVELTANGWELTMDMGMKEIAAPVFSYQTLSFIKVNGDTPVGSYIPDTTKANYLNNLSSVRLYPIANADPRISSVAPAATPSGTDVTIAAADSNATALTKFQNAVANGYNCYFQAGGSWNNDWIVTMTGAASGMEFGYYGAGARPIIRGSTPGQHVMKFNLNGTVSNIKFFGLDFDGRNDGSTLDTLNSDRSLLEFRRGDNASEDRPPTQNTLSGLEIVDCHLHHADNLLYFADDWCFARRYAAVGSYGPLGHRSSGFGAFSGVKVHKNIFSYAIGRHGQNLGIVVGGIKNDYVDFEVFDNAFYKIGYVNNRSDQLMKAGEFDSEKDKHGIYEILGGSAAGNYHHNWFIECAAWAIQMRQGGYFTDNVVIRTAMGALLMHRGKVNRNVFLELTEINPNQDNRVSTIQHWRNDETVEIIGNIIGMENAAFGKPPILTTPNSITRNNTLVEVPSGGQTCYRENDSGQCVQTRGFIVKAEPPKSGACLGDSRANDCEEMAGIDGNRVLNGADAAGISLPTKTNAWVETNLVGRAVNTWVENTHSTEAFIQLCEAEVA